MKSKISFGTSGHRGIIGETFTLDHVKCITAAIAQLLTSTPNTTIALGYDPRKFNCEQLKPNSFTEAITSTLQRYGIHVDFFDTFCPTPCVSWYIKQHKLAGGLVLTASHNPPEYNGLKFNMSNGAPAPASVTAKIEALANSYLKKGLPKPAHKKGSLRFVHVEEPFARSISDLIQTISGKPLTLSDINLAIDVKHGACGHVWDMLFALNKPRKYQLINSEPLANLGNIEPNPTKYEHLKKLSNYIKSHDIQLGIANDPDGDRHVILDESGRYLLPEETTLIILNYFIEKKVAIRGIATTVASSRIIKLACKLHNIEYLETAVGFKHFADFLEESKQDNSVALAVESSGGFTISSHTLEKCGFLPGILLAHICSEKQKPLSELKKELYTQLGEHYFLEREYRFLPDQKNRLKRYFMNANQDQIQNIFSQDIVAIQNIDGLKVIFSNDDWILLRLSGTEPVARLYAEASKSRSTKKLLDQCEQLLNHVLAVKLV
ncbi:hypothetical protein DID76_00570 [Candidatus Marinamargulisbacteria bacterium SCGC AG-414-C22]|nr:hypothetical protein DID76_00570 [Candidatus Marinamargulisbacteria bacterium SCGC AG-414-C22]